MRYFLCKTILHSRRTITVSPTHCLQNYQSKLVTVKHISSNANRHSFVVSYLINSCGLSLESALSASKNVDFDSPENPDSVVSFFKNHGFSKTQISGLLRQRPELLKFNPKKTFLPKFEFFYSKGFSTSDLAKTISDNPSILASSLEKRIIPRFNFCKDLLKSDEIAVAAIKRYPRMLTSDLEKHLVHNVNILRENRVHESCYMFLLRYHTRTFASISPDMFKEIVEKVTGMGFNPSQTSFCLAIHAFLSMNNSTWEKKVDVYKKWGWSDKDIFEAFRRNPWCMTVSEDKITAIMDFCVNKIGWERSLLVEFPGVFSLSLEKRIVPRGSVAQVLLSRGLVKKNLCISTLFQYPEKLFLKRFVDCYKEEAPQLMDLYEEKLNRSGKQKGL